MSQPLHELICTRICHDLIGNIGAVGNAVELLEEGDMDFLDDIKSILKTSSSVLSARLKFFRLAFGLDNANLQNGDVVRQSLADYLQTIGNKNFPIQADINMVSAPFYRMALLGGMLLSDLFIRGGRICAYEDNGKLVLQAQPESGLAAEKADAAINALTGNPVDEAAWLAPAFYLRKEASDANLKILAEKQNILTLVIG